MQEYTASSISDMVPSLFLSSYT